MVIYCEQSPGAGICSEQFFGWLGRVKARRGSSPRRVFSSNLHNSLYREPVGECFQRGVTTQILRPDLCISPYDDVD